MIAITGATGTVGREVARRLPAAHPCMLLTRSPEKTGGIRPGAAAVRADLNDRAGLAKLLAGVTALFVVTCDPFRPQDENLVEAAQEAGVRRLVKLSALAVADPGADDLITGWHRASEERIRTSELAWTILRPRAFMSNTLAWARSVKSERTVRAFQGAARNACVDPADIADAAVRALTGPGSAGRIIPLTGPEALSPREQTAQLAAELGTPLRFEELTRDQVRAAWARHYPDPVVEALLQSAQRQQAGAKSSVEQAPGEGEERPARTYRAWVREHRAAFL
ncbi:NAD(P)H-binding protein [Streptomyces sp. NBC_00239]|uniref:NAD(P)H-binding protein n=1 Tax=Streptomyces sp. NBC_00239 TaxID=2903640 RepID=UPI002E284127|nr:NAD(P)H-binding protein [Streptomyces sp. NBC_00239]